MTSIEFWLLMIAIFVLILISAFFSSSETALTAASDARMHQLSRKGDKRASLVKSLRLKRFKSKKGDKELFDLLNRKQLNDNKKIKFSNYVVVNEKNLKMLKKNLLDIIQKNE